MKILKFGGTSMGSAEALQQIERIFDQRIASGEQSILVCSAMSGVTNQLLEIGTMAEKRRLPHAMERFQELRAKHTDTAAQLGVQTEFEVYASPLFDDLKNLIHGIGLILELSERSKAYLMSFGERLSTRLLTAFLEKKGHPVAQFDSTFIRTEGKNFVRDSIDLSATKQAIKAVLFPIIQQGISPVITGFFGMNKESVISLLGRGGSDYSGAIIAVSLGVKTLEIWTDVDGFLTADPRLVNGANIIQHIGFQEAAELCFYGAKVLHPKTIRPVIEEGGQVRIRNTFNPRNKGTLILQDPPASEVAVISISSKVVDMITLDLFGIPRSKRSVMSELFQLSEALEVNIDMIAASEAQVSFCIENDQENRTEFLEHLTVLCPYQIKHDRSVICIVSPADVQGQIGVAGKIFSTIAQSGVSVEMYSQNASEIAQLITVRSEVAHKVISELHNNLVIRNN